jgi:signal transduction histidine kinase
VSFPDIVVILMCLAGAGIILLSLFIAISIRKTVSPPIRNLWMAIILLMSFFIAGYLLYAYSLYEQLVFPQETIIGLVFFGGACFVYLITWITMQTLQTLVDANKNLEEEIAARLKTEEELYYSRRLEALGTLTGGIAHEFNNILTSIIGYAEFLHDALPDDGKEKQYSEMVLSSATRAARLTESLLAYSRKQITHAERFDMNELLAGMEPLLKSMVGERTSLRITPAPEPLMLKADRSQLQQVFFNLASNATDSMPGGGDLRIMAERVSFGGPTAFKDMTIPAGDYALLHVEDTGSGMTPEVLRKIFEPFFSTKGVGKGTGLGLSVVYGIVKRHGGFITVESEPGRGSHFLIYLPIDMSIKIEQP